MFHYSIYTNKMLIYLKIYSQRCYTTLLSLVCCINIFLTGSSAVGLTAYVTKDPETKQLVLESGALVLCDGGLNLVNKYVVNSNRDLAL